MKKIIFLSLLLPQVSFAAELRPYLGLQLGLDYLKTESPEKDKFGNDIGIKFVPSIEMKNFYLDPGLGYMQEVVDAAGRTIDIKTTFAEVSFRYKMNEKWSLGPMTQLYFAADNRRTEEVRERSDSEMSNLGLQLVRQYKDWRVELQTLTSLGGESFGDMKRQLSTVRLGVQFNLGSLAREEIKVKQPESSGPLTPQFEEKTSVVEVVVIEKPTLVISMDGNTVHFRTNSAELSPASLRNLRNIADFLVVQNLKINKIKISGHTDRRGTLELNQDLSDRRAAAVKDIFKEAGVNCTLESEGYNYSRPLIDGDNKEAWAINRRTEIEFYGVEAPEELREAINHILKK